MNLCHSNQCHTDFFFFLYFFLPMALGSKCAVMEPDARRETIRSDQHQLYCGLKVGLLVAYDFFSHMIPISCTLANTDFFLANSSFVEPVFTDVAGFHPQLNIVYRVIDHC